MQQFNTDDIEDLNHRFESATAAEILAWAWERFGASVAVSSSFQSQSVPLLHLVSLHCPEMPVVFLDTGFHFGETLRFRDQLNEELGLNIEVLHPEVQQHELMQRYGEGLYRRDPDLCCHINKVEPMDRYMLDKDAWISGVRRDQTAHRRSLRTVEIAANGRLKIHPMLAWTSRDVWTYINEHKLPVHPLLEQGFFSIGCAPCTRPVGAGEDERSGRWADNDKTECGIHTESGQAPDRSASN